MKFEQTLNSSQKERSFPRGSDRRPLDFHKGPIVVLCTRFRTNNESGLVKETRYSMKPIRVFLCLRVLCSNAASISLFRSPARITFSECRRSSLVLFFLRVRPPSNRFPMDSDHHHNAYSSLTSGASKRHMSSCQHDGLNILMTGMSTIDDTEVDILNDETFGDCDLDAIKTKSDFGDHGEFLGDPRADELPAFFGSNVRDARHAFRIDHHDQSQQPSIDALLGEDSMRFSATSMHGRPASTAQQPPINPFFSMAISQAAETARSNPFAQQQPMQPAPPPVQRTPPVAPVQQKQQINYQLLKQFEQLLINKQVPPQERLVYIQAMMEKMQREAFHNQQQQQQQRQQQPPTRVRSLHFVAERSVFKRARHSSRSSR